MNGFKSFLKRNLQVILMILCGLLVVAGVLTFIFGAGESDGIINVLFIALGVVLILIGVSLALLAFAVGTRERANFFLYDGAKKANVSIDDLDFDTINKKMVFVMSKLTSSASKVWTENVFASDNEVFADGDDRFAPLVAYKILFDLSERSNEGVWNLYLMADAAIIDSIVNALELNEDGELANAFKFLHENAAGNYDRTKKFLEGNKKYIQAKMVKYVKANINRF